MTMSWTFLQKMTQVTHQKYRTRNYSTLLSLFISLIKRSAYDNITSGCVMSVPTLRWQNYWTKSQISTKLG